MNKLVLKKYFTMPIQIYFIPRNENFSNSNTSIFKGHGQKGLIIFTALKKKKTYTETDSSSRTVSPTSSNFPAPPPLPNEKGYACSSENQTVMAVFTKRRNAK